MSSKKEEAIKVLQDRDKDGDEVFISRGLQVAKTPPPILPRPNEDYVKFLAPFVVELLVNIIKQDTPAPIVPTSSKPAEPENKDTALAVAEDKSVGKTTTDSKDVYVQTGKTSEYNDYSGRSAGGTDTSAPDLYTTLGVSPSASQQEIKSAYRKIALKKHSDFLEGELRKQGYTEEQINEAVSKNVAEMQDVNAAYAVLGNEKNRNDYDNLVKKEQQKATSTSSPTNQSRSTSGSPSAGQSRSTGTRTTTSQGASTPPTGNDNLVFTLKPTLTATGGKTPKTNLKAERFKNTINAAGYIEFDANTVADLKARGLLPAEFRNSELNFALQAFTKGVKSDDLFDKTRNLNILNESQKQPLYNISHHLAALEITFPQEHQGFRLENQNPDIEISRQSASFTLQPDQMGMEIKNNILNPILDKIKGKISKPLEAKAKNLITQGLEKGGSKLLGKQVAIKAGIALGKKALAQAAASIVPGIGNVVMLVADFLKDIAIKAIKWISQKAKQVAKTLAVVGLGMFAVGVLTANTALAAVGAGITGIATAYGGVPQTLTAISQAGTALIAFFTSTVIPSIAIPTILAAIAVPILIAIIIFIINAGAYVVPYGGFNTIPSGSIENPYIGVEKVASPESIDNPPPSRTVTYTITVTARQGSLSNVSFDYTCRVIGMSSGEDCPDPNPAIPDPPSVIAPTEAFTFTYQAVYDSRFSDSVAIDTFTVSADVEGESRQTAAASASVTIGNPPIDCPLISYDNRGLRWASYTPGDETRGHGSTAYWAGSTPCRYSLPQSINCMGPISAAASSNVCYSQSSKCAQYGYALDVWPVPVGAAEVFAPRVLGENVAWSCSHAFTNGGGSAGHTFHCSGGGYLLVLTHMSETLANGGRSGNFSSGQRIGNLFPMSNEHLHMEFSIGGVYERPEDFFCF
jgi:curved DNA-binding protein CbpA